MMTNMTNNYFKNIVGQEAAKEILTFRINNYNRSGHIPHTLFNAPKGTGKTLLARTVASNLKQNGKAKKYVEINCATVKNMKQFCEQILLQHVVDRDVTVHFDEASELPKDVEMGLLTILNPNDSHQTTFSYDEFNFDFNFNRQSFLFSTTEAHKMFHALKDRLKRVDLENYSPQDIQGIVALYLDKAKVNYDKKVLPEIASVLRGNARQAVSIAGDISDFMHGKSTKFGDTQWNKMKASLHINPLGISPTELNVLRAISERSGTSLTQLSAITGMSRESLQKDGETFLLQNQLMEIRTPGGRCITARGIELLAKIDGPKTA